MLASLARFFIIDMETKYLLFIHLDHDEEKSELSSQHFSPKNWFTEFVMALEISLSVFILFFTWYNTVWRTCTRLDENIFYAGWWNVRIRPEDISWSGPSQEKH